MTSIEFTTWLKGFFDISKQDHLTKDQLDTIKDRLNAVQDYPHTPQQFPISYPNPMWEQPIYNPYQVTCNK